MKISNTPIFKNNSPILPTPPFLWKKSELPLFSKILKTQIPLYKLYGIPESSCARKEAADIDILVTSRNSDRKIMQSFRITSRPPSRIRNWNQFSQFRRTSTKVMPIEKT